MAISRSSERCNCPLDAYSLVCELLLELSSHVILVPLGVVKVTREFGERKAAGLELLEGEIVKIVVIRLESDLTVLLEQDLVLLEECPVCKPSLGLVPSGPGIAEIDIDPVDLILGKIIVQELGIGIYEEEIWDLLCMCLLYGGEYYGRVPFESYIEYVRVLLRSLGAELALTAAEF